MLAGDIRILLPEQIILLCPSGLTEVIPLSLVRCRGEAVAVCSIEKANVTVNRLVQETRCGKRLCPAPLLPRVPPGFSSLCSPQRGFDPLAEQGKTRCRDPL